MLQCGRLLLEKKREKADVCCYHLVTYPQVFCETEVGGEAYDRNECIVNNVFIILWNDSINYHKRCLNYCISNRI